MLKSSSAWSFGKKTQTSGFINEKQVSCIPGPGAYGSLLSDKIQGKKFV